MGMRKQFHIGIKDLSMIGRKKNAFVGVFISSLYFSLYIFCATPRLFIIFKERSDSEESDSEESDGENSDSNSDSDSECTDTENEHNISDSDSDNEREKKKRKTK